MFEPLDPSFDVPEPESSTNRLLNALFQIIFQVKQLTIFRNNAEKKEILYT